MKVSCAYEGCEERIQAGESAEPRADAVPGAAWSQGRPLQVLVVDDDEDLRILARKALVQGGHEVWEAAGGTEALRLLESRTPDLVLLDLNMPAPDGSEVLRVIRSRERTRSLPVVVLTAHGDEQSARTSFELGATDFLPKPFTPPQLNARVRASFAHAIRT